MNYERRIQQLADELGATIHYDVEAVDRSYARTSLRQIHIPSFEGRTPAQKESIFWTALHELGHVAQQHMGRTLFDQLIGPDRAAIDKEAEAWGWALDNADQPLDAAGRAAIQHGLGSYLYSGMYYGSPSRVLRRVMKAAGPEVSLHEIEAFDRDPVYLNMVNNGWVPNYRTLIDGNADEDNELANAA